MVHQLESNEYQALLLKTLDISAGAEILSRDTKDIFMLINALDVPNGFCYLVNILVGTSSVLA
ncbi:3794_t:CDS:2 [Funneliformis geosporum]|uniref:3794_t:CDS:1 n=1 Tax=Funneliformis geosporum TaxID=1117311 RepID=A0A9W4SXM7_9GLOM|nr:3794_t:CDS:2 [Funneliformis geosporum]